MERLRVQIDGMAAALEADDSPAWLPYRRILADVPRGSVADCVAGLVWTSVVTDTGDVGVALTFPQGLDESNLPGSVAGTDLRTAARWLLSWRYYEAAIGCASVNAVTNTRARIEHVTQRPLEDLRCRGAALFERLAEQFAGGRVAVVGHFPALGKLGAACDLTVLERRPGNGDTPDPACEYVLPGQDCVCITGSAVTNKTLPRLLKLSRSAFTVLVGPSVPLSPVWFDHGVDLLAGAVVTDAAGVHRCVCEGAHRRTFREGLTTVQIAAGDIRRR